MTLQELQNKQKDSSKGSLKIYDDVKVKTINYARRIKDKKRQKKARLIMLVGNIYEERYDAYFSVNDKIYLIPPRTHDLFKKNTFDMEDSYDFENLLNHFNFEAQVSEFQRGQDLAKKPDLARKHDIVVYNLINDVFMDYFHDILKKYISDDTFIKQSNFKIPTFEMTTNIIERRKEKLEEEIFYLDDLLEKVEKQYEKNKDKDIESLNKKFYNFMVNRENIILSKVNLDGRQGFPDQYKIPRDTSKNFEGFKVNGENRFFYKGTNKKEAIDILRDLEIFDKNIVLEFSDYFTKYCS